MTPSHCFCTGPLPTSQNVELDHQPSQRTALASVLADGSGLLANERRCRRSSSSEATRQSPALMEFRPRSTHFADANELRSLSSVQRWFRSNHSRPTSASVGCFDRFAQDPFTELATTPPLFAYCCLCRRRSALLWRPRRPGPRATPSYDGAGSNGTGSDGSSSRGRLEQMGQSCRRNPAERTQPTGDRPSFFVCSGQSSWPFRRR